MIRLAALLWLSLAASALHAREFKPFRVLAAEGGFSLMRFEDEPWPMEIGQDLPGDLTLTLEAGAEVELRALRRVDLAVSGPSRLRFFSLETQQGEELQREIVLRLEYGELMVDPRFLLARASHITLELPDSSFEVKAGPRFCVSAAKGRKTLFATVTAGGSLSPAQRRDGSFVPVAPFPKGFAWSGPLRSRAKDKVPLLVLGREFDRERGIWPRAAVLGSELSGVLEPLEGLRLVDGSGSTLLARHLNGAIRSGNDAYLQDLSSKMGARWVLVGNLVVDQVKDSGAGPPRVSALAEVKLLEAMEFGDELVTESAFSVVPREGRSYEETARQALEAAASRVGRYLRTDLSRLLEGSMSPPRPSKVVFKGVTPSGQKVLRRNLAQMDSVQRFAVAGFSNGVLTLDLVLRQGREQFFKELLAAPWEGQILAQEPESGAAGTVFSLRPGPP